MYIDVIMPLTLSAVTLMSVILNSKVEGKLKFLFLEKQITNKDLVFLAILMVALITIVAVSARYGSIYPLMMLFLFSYSTLLFIFSHIFFKKWHLATAPPIIFVLLYLSLKDTIIWSLYLVNVYAIVFAILITLYFGSIFTWKTTWIFALLLIIVDVIMVFITKFMVEAAEVGLGLELPIAVILPTFPSLVGTMILGLGDFFLAGLLAIQLCKKHGRESAIISVVTIAIAFFIFEIYSLNYYPQPFPASLIVTAGWLPVALFKSKQKIIEKLRA